MNFDNKKILTISFLVAGVLVAVVINTLLVTLSGAVGAVARVASSDMVRHGLPVGLGVLTFFVLQFSPKIVIWADEVVVEVRKVVWPSPKNTMGMTFVVCVMVVISGITIWMLDLVSAYVLNFLVR